MSIKPNTCDLCYDTNECVVWGSDSICFSCLTTLKSKLNRPAWEAVLVRKDTCFECKTIHLCVDQDSFVGMVPVCHGCLNNMIQDASSDDDLCDGCLGDDNQCVKLGNYDELFCQMCINNIFNVT